jgi:hypothetical protein
MQIKSKVKAILKMLKHQQIAQINRIHQKNREEQEMKRAMQMQAVQKIEMQEEQAKIEKYTLIDELRRMSPEEKKTLLISLDGNILHNELDSRLRGLTHHKRRMLVGKRLEDLSPEIAQELMNDRIYAKHRQASLPEMIHEIERNKRIEKQMELRRKQRSLEPPKQLGR